MGKHLKRVAARAPKIRKGKSHRGVGRPQIVYTEELAKKICRVIATTNWSINKICNSSSEFPCKSIIYDWRKENAEFDELYIQAKRDQADYLAEEIIGIADDDSNDTFIGDDGKVCINAANVARAKLRVDSRKWMAVRLLPRLYGDKLITEGTVTYRHEDALKELE